VMVGIDFPANLFRFVGGFTNLDSDAVNRLVVRAPHGSYDQGVRFAMGLLSGEFCISRTEYRQEKYNRDPTEQ
jgi:hypothetical protein